jgi:hypothetical protein
MADPEPRVVNVPCGTDNKPASERPVGSNLAVFAVTPPRPREISSPR